MKKLTKSEVVAVFVGVATLGYVFFSNDIKAAFSTANVNVPAPQQMTTQSSQLPETGFVKKDVVVGTGAVAEAGDTITAHYVGMLPDGKVFDSSLDRGQPIEFTLGVGQVIKGWDQGLVGMREGGRRILEIAPDFGYGSRAMGPIPANSTLVFQVELLKVSKPAK